MEPARKAALRAASASRMIAWTAAAALASWGATLSMVRAVAQETAPQSPPTVTPDASPPAATTPGAEPPIDGDDTNEEAPSDRARAPVTLDEPPEFRDSADNNISLPVDI